MSEFERTFVMLKPDAIARGLIGEVISRIEKKGLKITAMKLLRVSRELAEKQYAVHKGKAFFEPLIEYITSGPSLPMVVEGKSAVQAVRTIIGKTNSLEASPGTIRGDFGMTLERNVIHAADSVENARIEMEVYFTEEEICNYTRIDEQWLYE
ncbi:MAG: nucleoside-diphosphate kinase [Candidatus Sifarchaeia archaeon]|jgi:nucleoside-diphosphate kinase